MNLDPGNLPPLPTYTATGVAMFLEPIAGSGERLCVAVAARGEDGRWRIAPVLGDDQARCMVGEQADRLFGFARVGMTSLEQHLESGEPLNTWSAPASGLTLGPIARGHVTDLPMMLRTLARNHAFLSSPPSFSDTSIDDTASPDDGSEKWLKQVRHAVNARNPLLDGAFSQRITLVEQGIPTRLDFLGHRLAAQIGCLIPGSALSRQMCIAKAKLWDLEALRDSGRGPIPQGSQRYELLIYRPADNGASYSDRSMALLRAALTDLEAASDRRSLRVRPVFSTDEAAEAIIAAEAGERR